MNKTIKNIFYFSISVVFVKVIGIFNTFYLAKLLLPSEYGVWMTLLLITAYSTIACLGTVEALVKLYPFYTGQNRMEDANNVERGVFGSIFYSAGIFLVGGLIISLFLGNSLSLGYIGQIRIMVLTATMSLFSSFYYFRLISHQNFKRVGLVDGIRSVTNFAFLMTFTRWWGLKGTVMGFCINEGLMMIISYYYCRSYGKLKPLFEWKVLVNLIKIGFPITIIWWIYMVQSSISRILSMHYLGKTSTGYLGLGVSIVSILILIPMTIGRVLYPKINEEIGKSDTSDIGKFVIVPARLLSLIVAMALGALVIITPLLIDTYFKKYLPAINCTILLLLGGYFVSLNQNGINYLVAANKQRSLLYFIVTALAVNLVVCFGFIKAGFGIIGIALGSNISSIVFTSLIWYSVFFRLQYPVGKCFYYLLKLYMPFIITSAYVGALILLRHLNTEKNHLTLGVYLFSYCIFFAASVRFFPLLSELKGDLVRVAKMRGVKRAG